MHPTNRQLKFYILYCITQLSVWFLWSSDWKYYNHMQWSGLHTSDHLTFTSGVAIPFLLGLLLFSIIFLPFYIRREDD